MVVNTLTRFWAKIYLDLSSDCWLWQGYIHKTGYGYFNVRGKMWRAHRWSYTHFIGPIPPGLSLDHLCRVRNCVNPVHLEPASNKENCRRGLGGWNQRIKTHCPQGHIYGGRNLVIRKPENGHTGRGCRTCRVMATQKWRRKTKPS